MDEDPGSGSRTLVEAWIANGMDRAIGANGILAGYEASYILHCKTYYTI